MTSSVRASRRDMMSQRSSVAAAPLATTSQPVVLSQPLPVDLVLYRGDSGRFRVTVTDAVGAPIDVSAATWNCTIRESADDSEVLSTFTVQPVQGDPASVDVILPADESYSLIYSTAVWDLQMTIGIEVQTLMAGKCLITKDVSRP